MINKIKEPSRSIALVPVKTQLENIIGLIDAANVLVATHNLIVTNYATEKANLIKSIWRYVAEENKLKSKVFQKIKPGFKRGSIFWRPR